MTKISKILFCLCFEMILCVGFSIFGEAWAQPVADSLENVISKLPENQAEVTPVTFPDLQKKYDSSAFDYSRDESQSSFWEEFLYRIFDFFKKILSSPIRSYGNYTDSLKVIVFLLGLSLFIYLIIRNKDRIFFRRKAQPISVDFTQIEQNLAQTDFPKLIAQAEAQNQVPQSIRLYYLWLLKELSQRKIITWEQRKTNNDYAREIQNPHYQTRFKELSLLYNYIWYGHFQITDNQYKTAKKDFEQMITELKKITPNEIAT